MQACCNSPSRKVLSCKWLSMYPQQHPHFSSSRTPERCSLLHLPCVGRPSTLQSQAWTPGAALRAMQLMERASVVCSKMPTPPWIATPGWLLTSIVTSEPRANAWPLGRGPVSHPQPVVS